MNSGFIKNLFLFAVALGFFFSGAILLWAATLQVPDLKTFDDRKVSQSTKIYDRTGEVLLYDIHEDIRRTIVPFDDISRNVKNATVAIEDTEFYNHIGVRPLSTFRAVFIQPLRGKGVQGGSTITQQVVKNSLLTSERKISRKLKEWALAIKLEQVSTKERILELYLNEVPYGGSLYGIEEAGRAYFGKSAGELSLAESAYLAALPQAPTFYLNNRDELENRKNLVLARMHELGFISGIEYKDAKEEALELQPQAIQGIRAPHFVFYVREQLEKKYGKDVIATGGLSVITSLDYELQQKAEEVVANYAKTIEENFNASNAAIVAVDPKTGHILTMIGSRNYFDEEIDGNFNVAVAHRQPGSAFKPFVYATVIMKGYTPETVVFDLETEFNSLCTPEGKPKDGEDIEEDECYSPVNYDGEYHGPMTLRDALAQSVNVPSVKALYLAGLTDSISTARAMGITSLTDPNRYGLTLVLGGGEVSLLDITSAYSVFANDGRRNPHTAILEVRDQSERVLERFEQKQKQVLPEVAARAITDILSDNEARTPAFGARSPLYFAGYDIAAKTGTTNDYRDAWIIGYSPTIAVGAWAGNNDNSPMEKKVAGFTVAPLWHDFMEEAVAHTPKESFGRFPKLAEDDSMKPILRGGWLGNESYFIDRISGKLATEHTPDETKEERFVANVHSILYWIRKDDPHGAQPEKPEKDVQFELWETPVRKWVEENKLVENVRDGIPTEKDDVHTPENIPTLEVFGIEAEQRYSKDSKITIVVNGNGKYPLQKADLFINNIYINSTESKPFVFSFTPNDLSFIEEKNILRIVGYDEVFNKVETGITLNIIK